MTSTAPVAQVQNSLTSEYKQHPRTFAKPTDPRVVQMTLDANSQDAIYFRDGSGGSSTTNSGVHGNSGHCHTGVRRGAGVDKIAQRKLIVASILCLLFTIGEAVGGILARSLAIATDSAHMLTDFASFMISLLAIYLASRAPTQRLSFGWHRAEIMGALVSVQLIWVVTGVLVYMAVQRCIHQDYEINATIMMITASFAVLVNILLGATLHGVGHNHSHFGGGHSHAETTPLITSHDHEGGYSTIARPLDHAEEKPHRENLNVRAAFIHVIGDLVQSIGVLVASIIIYFKPEYKLADPICTFIFSILVLFSTISIFKDAVSVLMEATPAHINYEDLQAALMKLESVKYVHDLRIWSLTTTRTTMTAHVAIENMSRNQKVLRDACELMTQKFGLEDPTIQIEEYHSDMDDCTHCEMPEK